MSLSYKVKLLLKDERLRTKTYKLCLFGLLTGITYLTFTFNKPHGTFGKPKLL
jgi:hypothetical protein